MFYSNRRYPFYGSGYYRPGIMLPCMATVCCCFMGCGFSLMGLIMTITAYSGPQISFAYDPFKIIGPIFLCLGLLAVGISVGLGCYTFKKKKALESQPVQSQSTQSAYEPQPYSAYSGPNNPVPDVYDPERRVLTTNAPSPYSTSFGQMPASQMPYPMQEPSGNQHYSEKEKLAAGISSHPPYSQQPSCNPDFGQPVP